MYHLLFYANETYYIIHEHPKTPIDWVLCAYAEKIATVKTKDKKKAVRALQIIALIHHIEKFGQIKKVPYY